LLHEEEEFPSRAHSNPVFFTMLMISGSMFVVGFLIFAFSTYKTKSFSKWAILFLALGVVMFIPGFFPYVVRTIGIVVYAIGLIWVGYSLIAQKHTNKEEKQE
jgi:predicted membrane protein